MIQPSDTPNLADWSAAVVVADRQSIVGCREVETFPNAGAHVFFGSPADMAQSSSKGTPSWDAAVGDDCSDRELRTILELAARLADERSRVAHADRTGRQWAALANSDPVTALPNRRHWDVVVATVAERDRDQGPLVCAVFDVDCFKDFNDRRGHSDGDELLRAVADGLRNAARHDDLAARLGGDEFGLLMPGLEPAKAAEVVERIRHATVVEIQRRTSDIVTLSAGFAAVDGAPPVDGRRLFDAADAALLQAKRQGRDRTIVGHYSPAAS